LNFEYEELYFIQIKQSFVESADKRFEIYLSNKFLIKAAYLNFKYKNADILNYYFMSIETELKEELKI